MGLAYKLDGRKLGRIYMFKQSENDWEESTHWTKAFHLMDMPYIQI